MIGQCVSLLLLLLQTFAEHGLLITTTVFRLRNRASWMHPHYKHCHLIDYVNIRKRDRQDVPVTGAKCGSKSWTDHRHIISKLNLSIKNKRRPQGTKTHTRLNVNKQKLSCIKRSFTDTLEQHLDATSLDNQDVESAWAALPETVYNRASSRTCGRKTWR